MERVGKYDRSFVALRRRARAAYLEELKHGPIAAIRLSGLDSLSRPGCPRHTVAMSRSSARGVLECIPIPPLADIKSRGYKSALDWLSKTSQVDARNDANTEKLTLLSRPSREFTAKKTRPLNQKLADFLDFLFRCVAVRVCKIEEDEYTEAKCVKLFKSLRAAREHGGQARG